MFLQKYFVLPVLLLTSLSLPLMAEESSTGASTSEFYHQAEAGSFELTPMLSYQSITIKYKRIAFSTLESSNISAFMPGVRGEYGLNSNYSLGASFSYVSSETTYSPASANIKGSSTKGLADPVVSFAGHNDVGTGAIHYGTNLSFSLEKSTSNADGTSNAASGGHRLTPYLGYDLPVGKFKLGTQLAYDLVKSDRTNDHTNSNGSVTSTTRSNGQELTFQVFGELPIKASTLGLSLGYASSAKTKSTTGGTTTENNDAGNTTIARVYGLLPVGKVTLLSAVSYVNYKFADKTYADYVDSVSGWQLTAGARFAF